MNEETRKMFMSENMDKIEQIHVLLAEVLQVAPEDYECTDEAADMFADMQNLNESIREWKNNGSVVFAENEEE